jgi:uncharacterized membrane protein
MFWLQRKRFRAFLRNSLWVVPVASMLGAVFCAPLIRRLDSNLHFRFFGFGVQGARAVVGMIAAAMLSFIVFFFSVLLLTVQIASVNLSPRIISRPFKSTVLKASLGLFVFTFIYGVSVLGRLEDRVIELPVFLTILLNIASIGTFLFVVEYVGKELRPATVVARVAQEGLRVIRSVYPHRWSDLHAQSSVPLPGAERVCLVIRNEGAPGVVVAFDTKRLFAIAVRYQCTIELIPQVGDYVPSQGLLCRVYGGGHAVKPKELRNAVALGRERTLEQDPGFAFRIIVDIAEKALSPAINDPTTGVIAIDQLQYLLQEVGERDLSTGTFCDQSGQPRLVYRTPEWQDFVLLAVSEIRQYGANSIQIMRRLSLMLEYLIANLPPERARCLQQQLDLLRLSVEKTFFDPRDRVDAEIADSQGLGGTIWHTNGSADWVPPAVPGQSKSPS